MRFHQSKTIAIIVIAVIQILIVKFVKARQLCSLYGKSSGSGEAKIVGGQDAVEKELPYQLLMIAQLSDTGFIICGAVLINETHVLTAAHCTHDRLASTITLYAGVTDINRSNLANAGTGPNVQARKILRIIEHPGFENHLEKGQSNKYIKSDLALMEVSEAFEINDYVRPIKLPIKNMNLPDSGTISGWGCMSKDISGECKTNPYVKLAPVLQKTTVRISKDNDCAGPLQPAGIKIFTYQICVGDDGRGACAGDSGGPFAIDQGGEKVLIGIASFATLDCACAGWPAVYTEVSYFLPWINYGIDDSEEQIVDGIDGGGNNGGGGGGGGDGGWGGGGGGGGASGVSQTYVLAISGGASLFIVSTNW